MMDEWKAQINSFNFLDRKFPCANRHGPIKRHRDQELMTDGESVSSLEVWPTFPGLN